LGCDGRHGAGGKRSFFDHLLGSSTTLFSRLEDEAHCAIKGGFVRLQDLACPQQHCHVGVMATSMHFAIVLQPGGTVRLVPVLEEIAWSKARIDAAV